MAEYTCHGCGEQRIFGVKHVCFSRVALPPASLGDEERAEAWADQFSEPKTHGPAARLVAKASALWGLRTSRAELLAEREKVRRLEEELEALKLGPRGRPKTIDRHQVKALLDHGLCTREIAKELGVSQSGVEKVLVEIREALKETE